MGVAALVLGIVSAVIAFIPFCGTWAIIPAIVGLILGIVDWVKKQKAGEPKGKAVAGTICSCVAIIIIAIWWMLAGAAVNKAARELESIDWNETFSEWNEALNDWSYTIDD